MTCNGSTKTYRSTDGSAKRRRANSSQQNQAAANLAAAGFACLTVSAHFFRKHGGEDAILPTVVFFFSLADLFHEVELGAGLHVGGGGLFVAVACKIRRGLLVEDGAEHIVLVF